MIKTRIFNCLSDYIYYQNGQTVYITYCSVIAYKYDTKEGKLYYKDGLSDQLQALNVYSVTIVDNEMDVVLL